MSYDKQDLEEMLSSGQVIRTEKLLTILHQNGFSTRRPGGGSSHIFFWHPDHPDILADTIVAETDNPFYQRLAINACLKSIGLRETAPENTMELVTHFHQSSTDAYTLPDHFEIVRGYKRRTMYLRHKQYPQLATELGAYRRGQDIGEWCDYLDGRAERLDALLRSAVDDYDFERTNYPNGSIVLMHPAREVNKVLHAFSPRIEKFRAIGLVEDAIAEVQLEHEKWSEHLTHVMDSYAVTERSLKGSGERIFYHDDLYMLQDNNNDATRLPVTKNGFFSLPAYMRFLYSLEAHSWQDMAKTLKQFCGFDLMKKPDGKLHGTHPIFDITFSIDDVRKVVLPEERMRNYYNLLPNEREDFLANLWNELGRRHDARWVLNEKATEFFDMRERRLREYALLRLDMSELSMRPVKPMGEMQTITLFDKNRDSVMNIKGLKLLRPVRSIVVRPIADRNWYYIPDNSSMDELRKLVDARMQNKTAALFSVAASDGPVSGKGLPGLPTSKKQGRAVQVAPVTA